MRTTLNSTRQDALIELINIAHGRAAASLSQLTGYRIRLEVPKVALHPLNEAFVLLDDTLGDDVSAVSQVFTGDLSGHALLILPKATAVTLEKLIKQEPAEVHFGPETTHELITEVGNIILSQCLGVFGNILQVTVRFSVPSLHRSDLHSVIQSTTVRQAHLSHAMVINTCFHLRESDLTGYLAILLGVTSLDRLLAGLDQWVNGQLGQ